MSRWLVIKTLLVVSAVFTIGPGWLSAERAYQGTSSTLVAASTEAAEFSVRTYKVFAPKQAGGQVVMVAELRDASQTILGTWKETWSLDREDHEQTLTLGGSVTSLSMAKASRSGRLTVNGEEVWAGQFGPGTPEQQRRVEAVADIVTKMGTIARDIQAARKDAVRLSSEWEMVDFAPRVTRSALLAAVRLFSFGQTLYAAGDDPGCSTDFEHCDFAVGATRSIACSEAKLDAGGECTNWALCIGCCAWQDPDCDCACVTGDFACTCLACGAACTPPI